VFGYVIGAYLYGTLGHLLIALYHLGDKVQAFRDAYQCYGALIILIKGVTPIPYKIVTITSGFAGYNIWAFIGFSLVARGMRFYLAALVLNRYGERVRVVIEKRLGFWVTLSVAVLVAGILAAVYLPGMSWWPGMPQWLNFCPAK